MSEKKHQREMFVEKRARALAMMLLTRREDLLIEEVKDDALFPSLIVNGPGESKAARKRAKP
jgi:hypothetical protein